MIRAFVTAAFSVLFAAQVLAQGLSTDLSVPDYETWTSVARRAEAAVDAGTDENSVFESLRARIVGFRATFDAARNANAERIATLKSQIDALGPAPEEGKDEATDIAARRSELNQQLATLQSPVQAAQEAYTRADGIIREIDAIFRERQTRRLLSLGPSPLNPVNWPSALEDLSKGLSDVAAERRVFSDARLMGQARENLPLVLLLLALSMVLLARGRHWATILGEKLRSYGGRGTGVWGFIISLLRILLPMLGVLALTRALFATELVGLRGTAILEALPFWAITIFGFRWLSERLFSRMEEDAILQLPSERRAEARFYITVTAVLLVLHQFLELIIAFSDLEQASAVVILFPVVVLLGMILFRTGQILGEYTVPAPVEDGISTGQGLARIVRLGGLAAKIVAIVAPVMAGIGYAAVANAMLFPMISSLALLGLVVVLQRFVSDLYGWVVGQGQAARESLVAVLLSFVLLIAAAPILALIWGARVSDLEDLWGQFLRGFTLGDATISPTDFFTFAVVFAGLYMLTRMIQNALKNSVLPKTRIEKGAQTAMVSGVGYVGIFLAAVIAITTAGIDLSSIALVAGALSVGIGFGLQTIVSNFVSGIILLIERPISEGDWIEVGGVHGTVRHISVRSTRIETFDRSDIIIPNSDLISGTVTNYTHGNTVGRVKVPVGVAYGTDTRRVEKILLEVAKKHPMVLMNPAPYVVFQGFGASSLDFEIRAILRDVNWILSVRSEMNHQIAEKFIEEGIEIPFPQQDLWLRNPEALKDKKADD